MGERIYTPVTVTGPLDTSGPSTNRAAGTLVRTVDSATQGWGPRRGGEQQTWVGRLPSTLAVRYPGLSPDFSFDGTNTYVKGIVQREQADLANRWTCDVAFHAYATRATTAEVPIFQWRIDSTIVAIEIGIYGSTHATNPNKVYAIVKSTSSAGVVDSTKTLVGGTPQYAGETTFVQSGKLVRCFVRLIRSEGALTLLDSTGTTATTATTATQTHSGNTTETGAWFFGKDTGLGVSETFNGLALRALIRDVADDATIYPPAIEHVFPKAPSVRFFSGTKLLTNVHVEEQSSFGAHGLVSTPGSITAGGDRHHPFAKTTQGMGAFVDRDGRRVAAVMVGGMLCHQRLR